MKRYQKLLTMVFAAIAVLASFGIYFTSRSNSIGGGATDLPRGVVVPNTDDRGTLDSRPLTSNAKGVPPASSVFRRSEPPQIRREAVRAKRVASLTIGDDEIAKSDSERRTMLQEADKKEGINQGLRDREALMREKSRQLEPGMSQISVTNLLGLPSTVGATVYRKWVAVQLAGDSGQEMLDHYRTNNEVKMSRFEDRNLRLEYPVRYGGGFETVLVYSPHPTQALYQGYRDSFQVLAIWFGSEDGKLIAWKWMTPNGMF